MENVHGEIINVKVASSIRAANMKTQQNAMEQDNNLQITSTSNQIE